MKITSNWQLRVAALVIFALGFVAGALALNLYKESRADGARGRRGQRLEQIVSRLNLNEQQSAEVKEILADTRSQLDGVRKESEPRVREIRKQAHERIQKILTPEQWQQFEQMMKENRGRRHRDRDKNREQ